MRILAIDYGERKIGLALAETSIADPYSVIRYESEKDLFDKIKRVIEKEKISEVVVGMSEGKIGEKSKRFGEKLSEKLGLKVQYQDEAFTTKEAQEMAISAGIKRKKRKNLEDAYSATLILQSFLDTK